MPLRRLLDFERSGSMIDIEVKVPATIANLGPGFDCLGVAIGVYLQMRVTPSDEVQITGKGRIRSVADSLIYRSFVSAFAAVDAQAPAVKMEMTDIYPSARGMGASASAIVAGLVAAREIGELDLSDEDLAELAVRVEGHGDNVLPAFFGGLVVNSQHGWLHLVPTDAISPMVLVAREKFKTEAARRVVPTEVPRDVAVANAAATASLVAALTGQAPPSSLLMAMSDELHEPHRLPLMPESEQLHAVLREKNIATALAGAGPSLISLVETSELESAVVMAKEAAPDGWQILTPGWDLQGAQVR